MGSDLSVQHLIQKRFYEAPHLGMVRGPLPEPPDALRRRRATASRLPPAHLGEPPSKVARRDPGYPSPSPRVAGSCPRPAPSNRHPVRISTVRLAHDVKPLPRPVEPQWSGHPPTPSQSPSDRQLGGSDPIASAGGWSSGPPRAGSGTDGALRDPAGKRRTPLGTQKQYLTQRHFFPKHSPT